MSAASRLRIRELPTMGRFGVKFHAKIEGILIAQGRTKEGTLAHAEERLDRAGVTLETPTWKIRACSMGTSAWTRWEPSPGAFI